MCCCGQVWTTLQVLWSTVYVICGAGQLISGIFFLISIPALHLSCNIGTGSWNVIVGIIGGMVACMGRMSSKRQEFILYMAVSILAVNSINVVLCEWGLYFTDMTDLLKHHPNHMLINYACFATRIATATVIIVSFLDTQFAFCSMQIRNSTDKKVPKKKKHHQPHINAGSHDQVSDIEFIIPRTKEVNSTTTKNANINPYSQSWVFDSDSSNPESPYLKILENGTTIGTTVLNYEKISQNGDTTHLIETAPIVQVEEVSDDSSTTCQSDRKLGHMRSFSRSTSPTAPLSLNSSHINLTHNPTPIYDCLETIYRSRVNTGISGTPVEYQAPMVLKDKVKSPQPQYASLMKELQKAIVSKKEPSVSTSTSSTSNISDSTTSSTSKNSSDVEFSKELEAALQLIQDLESPNTLETPTPVAPSSTETLSELQSPKKPDGGGKTIKNCVIVRHTDSQSTSGYSSPIPSTTQSPSWSTTSSLNGSSTSNNDKLSYSIHRAKSATVISLYASNEPTATTSPSCKKSVTLVNISSSTDALLPPSVVVLNEAVDRNSRISCNPDKLQVGGSPMWIKSLMRKKKPQAMVPKLCPELEAAIIKSESLAYLSELELLARHQRNNEIHREIEERVIQQLGTPRTESKC